MPYGVVTAKVGFIDIIAFGTDKQACLYDIIYAESLASQVFALRAMRTAVRLRY